MYSIAESLKKELKNIKDTGLYKEERVLISPQGPLIDLKVKKEVLNLCASNYLGLSNNQAIFDAAREGMEKYGFEMSSVRFICGTQDIHMELERVISDFLQTEDTMLYTSCYDANGGLFETLMGSDDAVISDQLNHASIIDGIRLCKAKRYRYIHSDMGDLEKCLIDADREGAVIKMITTDGVFSMEGAIAKLDEICDLADKYDALVMVDDSHATGFIGKNGRGTHEYHNVLGRVDIITSTLGKALGGSSGGFTSGRAEIISLLRQRSRPYLFSNSLPPVLVYGGIKTFEILSKTTGLRDKLEENTRFFREEMTRMGFEIKTGIHPIVPIMLYDARLTQSFVKDLLDEGVYAVGFFYPVVPKGTARIRVQISAIHTREHLEKALKAFRKIGKKHRVIS